jgi:hypothetical protein
MIAGGVIEWRKPVRRRNDVGELAQPATPQSCHPIRRTLGSRCTLLVMPKSMFTKHTFCDF